MPEAVDLAILGSGSTAFAAAIKASDLGARVAMVERRPGCWEASNMHTVLSSHGYEY